MEGRDCRVSALGSIGIVLIRDKEALNRGASGGGKERRGWIRKAENQQNLVTNQKLEDSCELYVMLVSS